MRRYDIPKRHAYHDGTRYHCYNVECFSDGATLKEIARIPRSTLMYIPILRCSECGATYFGLDTCNLEAVEVIRKCHEEREQAEKEREQNAITLARMDAEAFYQEEAQREKEQREEIAEHESELAGDLTIPNISGEPQRKTPPRNDDDGDIILPNILTA